MTDFSRPCLRCGTYGCVVDHAALGGEVEPGALKEIPCTLAERVAALEERLAYPLLLAAAPEGDGKQAADVEASVKRSLGADEFRRRGIRLLPPGPVLTREVVEAAIRECVTVVKPGETLVIRCRDWTPDQAGQFQEYADAAWRDLPFRVLAVIGDELAVAPAEPQGPFSPGTPIKPFDGYAQTPRTRDYPAGGPGCPGCNP